MSQLWRNRRVLKNSGGSGRRYLDGLERSGWSRDISPRGCEYDSTEDWQQQPDRPFIHQQSRQGHGLLGLSESYHGSKDFSTDSMTIHNEDSPSSYLYQTLLEKTQHLSTSIFDAPQSQQLSSTFPSSSLFSNCAFVLPDHNKEIPGKLCTTTEVLQEPFEKTLTGVADTSRYSPLPSGFSEMNKTNRNSLLEFLPYDTGIQSAPAYCPFSKSSPEDSGISLHRYCDGWDVSLSEQEANRSNGPSLTSFVVSLFAEGQDENKKTETLQQYYPTCKPDVFGKTESSSVQRFTPKMGSYSQYVSLDNNDALDLAVQEWMHVLERPVGSEFQMAKVPAVSKSSALVGERKHYSSSLTSPGVDTVRGITPSMSIPRQSFTNTSERHAPWFSDNHPVPHTGIVFSTAHRLPATRLRHEHDRVGQGNMKKSGIYKPSQHLLNEVQSFSKDGRRKGKKNQESRVNTVDMTKSKHENGLPQLQQKDAANSTKKQKNQMNTKKMRPSALSDSAPYAQRNPKEMYASNMQKGRKQERKMHGEFVYAQSRQKRERNKGKNQKEYLHRGSRQQDRRAHHTGSHRGSAVYHGKFAQQVCDNQIAISNFQWVALRDVIKQTAEQGRESQTVKVVGSNPGRHGGISNDAEESSSLRAVQQVDEFAVKVCSEKTVEIGHNLSAQEENGGLATRQDPYDQAPPGKRCGLAIQQDNNQAGWQVEADYVVKHRADGQVSHHEYSNQAAQAEVQRNSNQAVQEADQRDSKGALQETDWPSYQDLSIQPMQESDNYQTFQQDQACQLTEGDSKERQPAPKQSNTYSIEIVKGRASEQVVNEGDDSDADQDIESDQEAGQRELTAEQPASNQKSDKKQLSKQEIKKKRKKKDKKGKRRKKVTNCRQKTEQGGSKAGVLQAQSDQETLPGASTEDVQQGASDQEVRLNDCNQGTLQSDSD